MNDLTRGCVAEFIGTFALCFFGCGAIILTQDSIGAGSLITVAAAHGIALIVFVSACMYVSGAQFNPAVSIGLLAIGKQSPAKTLAFIVSQLAAAGSACGALVLFLCPVGLALQCLILGYGPQRGRGRQLAQEGRGKTLVLGVANTGFLLLVAASAERKAPGLAGLAWAVWLSMAFVGLHGIARGIGERVLSLPAVLSGSKPLKPLALGWCLLVAASAMPIVGWCMGIYWLIRGSGTAVVALLGRKPEPLVR